MNDTAPHEPPAVVDARRELAQLEQRAAQLRAVIADAERERRCRAAARAGRRLCSWCGEWSPDARQEIDAAGEPTGRWIHPPSGGPMKACRWAWHQGMSPQEYRTWLAEHLR